ncbi:unnamed protein product [Dovyalis caffra]|uniref:Uncharacterized protein n=1 Tax=Dovyalis caffra TaxID=77055 RepID=A0AAV1SQN3_9ROSI|nr:unnamed protein product [Dovyalis caffra]
MTRRCSHCSQNGHNSRTCPNRGVKLFGVRLTDGSIRKSASMGNLSHYNGSSNMSGPHASGSNNPGSPGDTPDHGGGAADGYASEDFVPGSSSSRERKKGVPWTEEEHRMFLLGLQKLGKGDWRGIARNYVISRTPTQVASHAQKYFIRQSNISRRKRRSSLFDIIADEPADTPMVSQDFLSTNHPQADAQSDNPMPAPPPLDEECESMDSTNSNEGEPLPPKPDSSQSAYPVVYPAYFSPFFPCSIPFWSERSAEPTKTETHEVLKPTAVHSKNPINVDELVGMSKLSLGESIGRDGPSSLSLKLVEGSSRQSAFHANPASSREKFLWYAPHSGFSNQLSEFKNGILMAGILNRTLIVPPVLDHHAVALGSCPKFRVLEPKEIRVSVWDHVLELIKTGRYISMADIIDISSLVPFSIQVIDFRVFASLWCNVNVDFTCINDLNAQSSLFDSLKQCGSILSGFDGNIDKCLYAVDEDCRTTVWTYKNGDEDRVLDSFQPDEQLKKRRKVPYVRRRQDVYKTLGPGSEAESATVLAFGSLFTAPYKGSELHIDIHEARKDQKIQSLIDNSEFLPFVPEILSAGKKFALETIKAPFLCAQLRLLDGQFKNHWKATFLSLKQKLEALKQSGSQPVHIFVMTDLPQGNWTGSFLGDLASESDHFKLYFLREEDELVKKTAMNLSVSGHGLRFGSVLRGLNGESMMKMNCPHQRLLDILLYLEESVCSCASLGFVGTAGSTIAESIELMRKFDCCKLDESEIPLVYFRQNKCWCQSYATLFCPMILNDPEKESFKRCLKILTGSFTALRSDMLLLVEVLDYEVIHSFVAADEDTDLVLGRAVENEINSGIVIDGGKAFLLTLDFYACYTIVV